MISVANCLRRAALSAAFASISIGASLSASGAAEKPAVEPVQTTATFGAWTVRCRTMDRKAHKLCEMIQVVAAKNNQGAVANLAIGRLPGNAAVRLVIQLPIGVHLPTDVTMKIGSDSIAKAEFQSCYSSFCLARADLDDTALARMKAADSMTVAFKDRTEKDATFSVSLSGFTAAHDLTFKAGS